MAKNQKNPTVKADGLSVTTGYVCWIDIMGTKNIMSESIQRATNFLLKFHSYVIDATSENTTIKTYPIMDGIFITASEAKTMYATINNIFSKIAELFIDSDSNDHRFVIRGSIAYGEIFHGKDIEDTVCPQIAKNETYKNSLMLGLPMIQAFISEKSAPPFGIFIHESARKYLKFQGKYYSWNSSTKNNKMNHLNLKEKILSYFKWCKEHAEYLEMNTDKIESYNQLVNEYFGNRTALDTTENSSQ